MRTLITIFAILIMAVTSILAAKNVKILIITGGHDFEREPFFNMFAQMDGIEFTSVEHPAANTIYATESLANYDVLVYYDMNQDITDEQKAAFLNMVKNGKGLVFLHHSLASYQNWDEFFKIQGGRYNLAPEDASKKSTYKHDVEMQIEVLDPNHPVTKGVSDFTILDEAYGNFEVLPEVHPLLKTDHPASGKIIGWTTEPGASKAVYLALGHDHHAYENDSFRTLVRNAILWTADR